MGWHSSNWIIPSLEWTRPPSSQQTAHLLGVPFSTRSQGAAALRRIGRADSKGRRGMTNEASCGSDRGFAHWLAFRR